MTLEGLYTAQFMISRQALHLYLYIHVWLHVTFLGGCPTSHNNTNVISCNVSCIITLVIFV